LFTNTTIIRGRVLIAAEYISQLKDKAAGQASCPAQGLGEKAPRAPEDQGGRSESHGTQEESPEGRPDGRVAEVLPARARYDGRAVSGRRRTLVGRVDTGQALSRYVGIT